MSSSSSRFLAVFYSVALLLIASVSAVLVNLTGTEFTFVPALLVTLMLPVFYLLRRNGPKFVLLLMLVCYALPLTTFVIGRAMVRFIVV